MEVVGFYTRLFLYSNPATSKFMATSTYLDPLQRPCYRYTTGSYGAAPKPRLKAQTTPSFLFCPSACLRRLHAATLCMAPRAVACIPAASCCILLLTSLVCPRQQHRASMVLAWC